MSNFKKDWRGSTRKEHIRLIAITLLMLIVGSFGIYSAIQYSQTHNTRYLLRALLAMGFMYVGNKIPWRNKTEVSDG